MCIVRETEHKASVWTAIYIVKTHTVLLLLFIYYFKVSVLIEWEDVKWTDQMVVLLFVFQVY